MHKIQFVKSCRTIAVAQLADPQSENYAEKHGLVRVEELTDDGSVVLVQDPGPFYGQQWEYGKPYSWERLPTMYELPDEEPEWETVYRLQEQLQQERQAREAVERRSEELARRLRELELEP